GPRQYERVEGWRLTCRRGYEEVRAASPAESAGKDAYPSMSKLVITLAAAAATGLAILPPPVEAQTHGSNVAEIIVYGNDPCPRSTEDQVVVCARRPEGERYRI